MSGWIESASGNQQKKAMPEYYLNILCISKPELTEGPNPVMSVDAYDSYMRRNSRARLRMGKGKGCPALLAFDMLRPDIKQGYIAKYGNPRSEGAAGQLRRMIEIDYAAIDFYAGFRVPGSGKHLLPERQKEYVANAQMLAVLAKMSAGSKQLIKALGGNSRHLWPNLAETVAKLKTETGHSLPANHLRLKEKVEKFANAQGDERYLVIIPDKYGNINASKVTDPQAQSTLRQLMRKHQNFDNEQIAMLYNIVAENMGWEPITAQTVANYRKKWDLATYGGRKGETSFDNTRAMLVKRKAPSLPLYYWTVDGWDAELLYQRTDIDKNGRSVTTYHNRPTMVVVLDPCIKYPVGYAVGTHETPELIRQALRNAYQHIKDLFGDYYKVLQLQTDNYGGAKLRSIYEFVSEKYTPARVHNAKAKVIEPWFGRFNEKRCQMLPNWSGVGVASGSSRQPNAEYLNKIRHSFPDFAGVKQQLDVLMHMERAELREQYIQAFDNLSEVDKKPMQVADFLFLLGETTGFVNRLTAPGVVATIAGEEKVYDSFDPKFRLHAHETWALKYNPDDTTQVLAVSAKGHNGRLEEVVGDKRFLLDEKYVQPMALREREEEDSKQLALVKGFNAGLKAELMEAAAEDYNQVNQLFEANPKLNNTLAKLVLVDSNGQHKDQKSGLRLQAAKKQIERQARRDENDAAKLCNANRKPISTAK